MCSKQTANRTVDPSDQQGILSQSTPLSGIMTIESAVLAPQGRGQFLHAKLTYFVHLLQRFHASHELEGIMAGVLSTDIALEVAFLNQYSGSMIDESTIGITRPAVDRALVLEYEDMLTGKSSKLSRSQCLRLGGKEIPKAGLFPEGRVPRIRSMGGLEGLRVISTSGPSILLSSVRTSGIAVI